MLPIINIGPLAVQTTGMILLLGLWVGVSISEKYSERFGVHPNSISGLVLTALVVGIFGGRLIYIMRYPGVFVESFSSVVSLNTGLFSPVNGLVLGVLGASIYGYRKGMPLWRTLDALTPLIAVSGIAFGLSHLASGTAFGAPTPLSWGIEMWGRFRYPTQIVETILAGIILVIVLAINRPGRRLQPGDVFLIFGALTALARLILEAFRGDSVILPGGFRVAQLIAWVVLVGCLIIRQLLSQWRAKTQSIGQDNSA